MNVNWHGRYVLPKGASLEQRSEWHRQHQAECGCRAIPAGLLAQMHRSAGAAASREAHRAPSSSAAAQHSSVADTRFSNIVLAFADQTSVSYGGNGLGGTALKFNGKIFVMLTAQGQFVVKLTRERVAELVQQEQGQHFEPGHGRMMMDWLQVPSSSSRWLALAKAAYTAASSRPSRILRPPAARSSVSRPSTARARKAPTTGASAPKPR